MDVREAADTADHPSVAAADRDQASPAPAAARDRKVVVVAGRGRCADTDRSVVELAGGPGSGP